MSKSESVSPEEVVLSDDEDYDDENHWEESSTTEYPALCLFCSTEFKTAADVFDHCSEDHNFHVHALQKRYKMDVFSFIKMINFIRRTKPNPTWFLAAEPMVWLDDENLKPTVEDDPLLMFDFESIVEPDVTQEDMGNYHVVNAEGDHVTLTKTHFDDLQHQLHQLQELLQLKDEALQEMTRDTEVMQALVQRLVAGGVNTPQTRTQDDDNGYFSSYSHFSIHHEMLSDRVRTEAYRQAILDNRRFFSGKSVLDLGCGTAILSMFSAKAGATNVVAVDQSDIIYQAMDIVRENGLESSITLLKGRLEDLHMEGEQFDVIVSEWMGYFLLFEGMLDSVIHARDSYLLPGGTLLPNRCTMNLIGVEDKARYDADVKFWDDVYGFRMSCLKTAVIKEAAVEIVTADLVITEACAFKQLDLLTCSTADTEFTADFCLPVVRAGLITSLVGYFDVHFDLEVPVYFSTGPHSPPTHWKQTIFHLPEPQNVTKGENVIGRLVCNKDRKYGRSLSVTITISGKTSRYLVN